MVCLPVEPAAAQWAGQRVGAVAVSATGRLHVPVGGAGIWRGGRDQSIIIAIAPTR